MRRLFASQGGSGGSASDTKARSLWRVNQVYWLCIVYIALWVVFRLLDADPEAPPLRVAPFLLILFIATLNLWLRTWEARQRGVGRHANRRGWIFTALDLSLIALGLRATGGVESALWIVFFVVVAAETVLEAEREANIIRWGAGIALILGTVPFPFALPRDTPYLLEIATRLFFLTALSIVTRRLRLNHQAREAELAALRAELGLAEERSRLSREIHDGVGNALAASVLRLEFAARTLEKAGSGKGGALDGADAPLVFRDEAQALREAMTAVRDWTFFTRPWSLNAAPGSPQPSDALKMEIDRLARRTNLPMTVIGASVLDDLPEPARLAALRILQEALTNAAKYAANATGAEVTLRRDGREVFLSIADDGSGFDLEKAGAGIGMASMRERAEGLGGTLHVDTAPGLGTTITARFPVA